MKKLFLILLILGATSFMLPQKRTVTIWLCGDSTMSIKEVKAYPETGWGMPFAYFFDSTVTISNLAKNGRSTKTFISEGLWKKVSDGTNEGDYVFIQFGHNDESKEKTERYAPPEEFKANLTKFVNETRARKAIPILLTPVSRRRFDSSGTALETHDIYSPLVQQVAKDTKTILIDLNKSSRALYQQYGDKNSRLLFLQLKPGEHPNYPEGKEDNTHFNELGARLIAELVLADLKLQVPELAAHLVRPKAK